VRTRTVDNISWPLLTVRAHGEYNYRCGSGRESIEFQFGWYRADGVCKMFQKSNLTTRNAIVIIIVQKHNLNAFDDIRRNIKYQQITKNTSWLYRHLPPYLFTIVVYTVAVGVAITDHVSVEVSNFF